MIQQLPAEVYQFGTPTAEFLPNTKGMLGGIIMGTIGLALLVGAFVVPALGVIGGLLVLAGIWVSLTAFLNRDLRVLAFAEGLVRIKGGRVDTFRWAEIEAVWQNVTKHYRNGIYHSYTLRRADGEQLKFNDTLKNVESLGNLIQQETFRRLLPRAIATYNAGGTVVFGKLSVSPQGLSNGKETLSWSEIKGVSLDKGIISVSKQGKWLKWSTTSVADTPNIFVFTTLVGNIVGINQK
jgi:hypothetical protein